MDNDKPARQDDKLIKANPLAVIESLPKIESLAKYIAKSETYASAFRGKDNKVNEGDIISAIILGQEMGISPMASITLGKTLNKNSFFAVTKGRSLGLDPVSSIENIHIFKTRDNEIRTSTGIHIITKAMLDSGVRYELLQDFQPVYEYYNAGTNKIIESDLCTKDGKLLDSYEVIAPHHTAEYLKEQKGKKVFVLRKEKTKITTIRFIRDSHNMDITLSMTLQDAIDASLYPGLNSRLVDAKGNKLESKGKDNWINYPATMLRNRVLATGGRLIASDKLKGLYETSEIIDLTDEEYITNEAGEVEVVDPENE